ncbi:hypothetical protein CUMW_287780, partial [Citrus unshiu]
CISHIISLTTPGDACRLAVVSPVFKSAADSDLVWERFLPSDYKLIISNSVSSSSLITSLSKKDLYFHLCHHPILINNGTMTLSVLYSLLNRMRFPEVAELVYFCFFEVNARIDTRILSHRTNYVAYLVFKFGKSIDGFRSTQLASRVYVEGINDKKRQGLLLDPSRNTPQLFHDRRDGWME